MLKITFFKKAGRFISYILQKTELLSASEHGCVLPSLPVFPQQSADLGTCDAIDSWIVFETVHQQMLHKHRVCLHSIINTLLNTVQTYLHPQFKCFPLQEGRSHQTVDVLKSGHKRAVSAVQVTAAKPLHCILCTNYYKVIFPNTGLSLSPLSSFLTFRKTARNFNQPMCKAAKTTIVEVRPSRKRCVCIKLDFCLLQLY